MIIIFNALCILLINQLTALPENELNSERMKLWCLKVYNANKHIASIDFLISVRWELITDKLYSKWTRTQNTFNMNDHIEYNR